MTIDYNSASCGSGKTHQIVQWACKMARSGRRVFIAQPTKDLIDKTAREELEIIPDHPAYRVFHGDTVGAKSIAKRLIDYLKDPEQGGQIIFITHALLPLVRFWTRKGATGRVTKSSNSSRRRIAFWRTSTGKRSSTFSSTRG